MNGNRITRRAFMAGAAAGAAATCTTMAGCKTNRAFSISKKQRPNIIFINVDQLTARGTISGLGGRHTQTPGIDHIVENGVHFDRTYAADPLCCPARVSWWTGRYSSDHGTVVNNTPCFSDLPDLGSHLSAHGYETFYVGKWHAPGIDMRTSFDLLHEGTWWGEISDADVTRGARALLRNYSGAEPFFLGVGYLNPHDVCMTYWNDMADGVVYPLEAGVVHADELPPLYGPHKHVVGPEPGFVHFKRANMAQHPRTQEQWQYYLYTYYRQVEMVDREVASLLQELEASRFRDNTLVVFVSDHGEGMGAHKMVGKKNLYDEGVHTPLAIATLGSSLDLPKGVRNADDLISGVDFFPTICDYAAAPVPGNLPGRSLRPMIEGRTSGDSRDYVFAENVFYQRMICTADYKYIVEYRPKGLDDFTPPTGGTHERAVEQLFNIEHDPFETVNLAEKTEAASVLADMRRRLDEQESRLDKRPIPDAVGKDVVSKIAKRILDGQASGKE